LANHPPPQASRDDRPNLELIRERAELLRELRQFFDQRGFLEVQSPCLARHCILDAFIDPIEVETGQLSLAVDLPPRFYLQTSPELSMKRMLAAGAPSIYSLGPVFRSGERGDHHNPEFTMLEWYQVDADLDAGIELLGRLAADTLRQDSFDVVGYRQLFTETFGFDPIDVDIGSLQSEVRDVDLTLVDAIGEDRDALLDVLLTERIQPTLGIDRPVIVKDYPLSQAALAKPAENDPQCAARFELFASGMELANGYDELRDASVLAMRLQQTEKRRIAMGRPRIERSTRAMEQAISGELPPCTGVALGVDRLLMVRCGADQISQVIPFPIEIA
jgi:lysyl-tRNA synthetase class 2